MAQICKAIRYKVEHPKRGRGDLEGGRSLWGCGEHWRRGYHGVVGADSIYE